MFHLDCVCRDGYALCFGMLCQCISGGLWAIISHGGIFQVVIYPLVDSEKMWKWALGRVQAFI